VEDGSGVIRPFSGQTVTETGIVELGHFLASVEASRIATTISQSTLLTGLLSGTHLLGLTLLVGGVLVSSLRLLGALLPDRGVPEVTAAAGRGTILGLAVSVTTGLLLFAPRASTAVENGIFETKMLLLFAAVTFHFTVYRRVVRRLHTPARLRRFTGAFGLALWFGVVLAGCAYILLD
jgi:hypothetical protein